MSVMNPMKNSNPFCKLVCLVILSAALTACGGGGGGGDGGQTTPTLSFGDGDSVTKFLIDSGYSNALTSNSSGAITYASSDTNVATVDASSGAITIVGPGTTTITASIAAAGSFGSASASYTLVVENTVEFNAWLGTSDTQVDFPASTSGMQFFSSTIRDNINAGDSANLSGTRITDTQANLNATAYYMLKNGQAQSSLATVSLTKFSPRREHQLIVHQDKMWLIGGNNTAGTDVWTSTDGKTWTPEDAVTNSSRQGHQVVSFTSGGNSNLWLIGGGTSQNESHARRDIFEFSDASGWAGPTSCLPPSCFVPTTSVGIMYHQSVAFQDKLWVIGGRVGAVVTSDVWSSPEGETWTQASSGFSPRYNHRVAEFNGKLWLIGGWDKTNYFGDIWSFDGTAWTQETANAPFGARAEHELLVFDNKLWLFGGRDSSGAKTDYWSSDDGVNWSQQTPVAPFPTVYSHQAVVFNDKLWVVGGNTSSGSSSDDSDKIWSSSDGINWQVEHHGGDFSARQQFALESFNNKLWVIAGTDDASDYKQDIWSSSDAINWGEESNPAPFTGRNGADTATFNGKLWLSGGALTSTSQSKEIWSFDETNGWQQVTTAAFDARHGHQMLTFQDQLWVLGGYGSGSGMDDNWSSSEGETWIPQSGVTAPAYGNRSYHQAVVFDNELWVIGGENGSALKNVWTSTDGMSWTPETTLDLPEPRSKHQAVVFNNAIWVIGGVNGTGLATNTIYKYTSAGGWSSEGSGNFSERHSHRVVEHNGELYLIGGVGKDGNNKLHDVWKSSDGVNWRHAFSNTISFE